MLMKQQMEGDYNHLQIIATAIAIIMRCQIEEKGEKKKRIHGKKDR